ncbi:MAG: methyltransferase type 11 [gamma proteobacterium symbiont of Ctena orbiculata]|nr:MAG: methyltransferase type 11 [gamma proteobacterium symbiont of Ctena orbiculata]
MDPLKKPTEGAEPPSVTNRELDDHGLAAVTLTANWSDGRASHEDHLHVDRFSVFREADSLPEEIACAIAGMHEGDRVSTSHPARYGIEAWSESHMQTATPRHFDSHHRRGLVVEPRLGRFYPQGFFHSIPGIFEDAVIPARIIDLTPDRMAVDFNHSMARFPIQVQFRVDEILPGYDRRGGRCLDPLLELIQYPGLSAPLADGNLTDFADHANARGRMDETDDASFYNRPRLVQHLDRQALKLVNGLYRRLLRGDSVVLDLMASFDSHLEGMELVKLHLLGMNREELAANGVATTATVQDLNMQPTLPYSSNSLDAIVCTASIEYLTAPEQVLVDVKRTLRPGGLFITAFSNRWFPTKAIRIWSDLHEFERVGMVTQWLQQAGFDKLATYSAKGWPRPSDDPHAANSPFSDPVYAVWGRKPR